MDVTVQEQTYRIGRLDARKQFHIVRRLLPILGELLPALKDGRSASGMEALPPLVAALAKLSDADADYCLFGLLKVVQRKQPNDLGWAPICTGEALMYADITMPSMLQLAWHACGANMAGFFDALPSDLKDAALKASGPSNG